MNELNRNVTLLGVRAKIPDMPEFQYRDNSWWFCVGSTQYKLQPINAVMARIIAIAADVACNYWTRVLEDDPGTGYEQKWEVQIRKWTKIASLARRHRDR